MGEDRSESFFWHAGLRSGNEMVDEVRSNIRLLLKYVEYKPEINSSLINALSLGKKTKISVLPIPISRSM